MGRIDEAFDRDCAALLTDGDPYRLLAYLSDARVALAGNGAAELRFWLAAHGAAGCRGFDMFHYESLPSTFTGCGFGDWALVSGDDRAR